MLSESSDTHQAFFSTRVNEATKVVNKQFSEFKGYFFLKELNNRLLEENTRLKNELESNFIEPDSTRTNLVDSVVQSNKLQKRKFTFLPAMVIGNTVTLPNNYIILERGEKQGVKKGMAVTSPSGIIGVVVDVSENVSKAMSLLHQNSRVSVMLKKDQAAGSLEWEGESPDELTLKNIPKSSTVKVGDSVVTSNYSANFPSNLMVGTVAAIEKESATNFYTLKIKPSARFYQLQVAYIIENIRFQEQVLLENKTPAKQ